MSLLSNLVSGAVGAAIASAAKDYIQKQGGLQAVVAQFEQQGLGTQMQSWIGKGQNLGISPEDVSRVLGNSGLGALAEKFGISPEMIKQQLAEHLPQVVDQMTPNGTVQDAPVAA